MGHGVRTGALLIHLQSSTGRASANGTIEVIPVDYAENEDLILG